jgi:uncharacterized protein YkwD
MMLHRRALLIGLAAGAGATAVRAEPAGRWLVYEARLRARIADLAGARLDEGYGAELLALNNRFRASQGRSRLDEDPELTLTARSHAADMAARRFFDHSAPDGFDAIDRCGLLVRRLLGVYGENIARQTGGPITPRTTFEGWRDSPGHRANMLRADYTHAGHCVLRIGETWWSVAVFGGQSASLAAPLPLRCDGPELNAALLAASPRLGSYLVSEPREQPRGQPIPAMGLGPRLDPGAWRLRPLRPRTERQFEILWGPIFIV